MGPEADRGMRALVVENLGEALSWIEAYDKPRPHPDAVAAICRLLPEVDTRTWFERKLVEVTGRDR